MRLASTVRQRGSILLEGLIAILIFSIGILAIVGMQAGAIKAATDAKYRSEAGLLANQLIGTMWVSDRTVGALQTNFNSPGGAAYATWRASVENVLPGVAANPPVVAVDANGVVTVSVFWLAPNETASAAPHQYVAIAQIK